MELPLAGHCRLIAGTFQHVAKCRFGFVKGAKANVVAPSITARHDFDSAGRTDRLAVAMFKSGPGGRKAIQYRCLKVPAAVAPIVVCCRVVSHDQDDVEPFSRACDCNGRKDEK